MMQAGRNGMGSQKGSQREDDSVKRGLEEVRQRA